jgi:hypothetical protein
MVKLGMVIPAGIPPGIEAPAGTGFAEKAIENGFDAVCASAIGVRESGVDCS